MGIETASKMTPSPKVAFGENETKDGDGSH